MFSNKIHEQAELVLREGNISKAIELYTKALELNPNDPNIVSDRGVAYLHQENKELSLKDLDLAIELQPNYGYRYACRAFVYSHFKDYDKAITDYEKAVELDPDDAVAHNNLGMILEQKGYKDKADERFAMADKLSKMEDHLLDVVNDMDGKSQKEEVVTIHQEIDPTEQRTKSLSQYQEFKKVFTSKKQFKEFLHFIKNGFKIK